jgi:hypothetical protein
MPAEGLALAGWTVVIVTLAALTRIVLGKQTISPALATKADESLRTMRVTPYTFLCRTFLPGLVNSPRKFAWAQAAVNLAHTACALERYRLAHGKYPETLAALAPQFISKVPHDPIGGQQFHYRLTDGGQFILYSVVGTKRTTPEPCP